MKEPLLLSVQDKYDLDYEKSYRFGQIEFIRKAVAHIAKKHKLFSKELMHKVNREVDTRILIKVLLLIGDRKLTLTELENIYDKLKPDKHDYGYEYYYDE